MELQEDILALSFDQASVAYFGAVEGKDLPLAKRLSFLLNQTAYSDIEAPDSIVDADTEDDAEISDIVEAAGTCFDEWICLDCSPNYRQRVEQAIELGETVVARLYDEFNTGLVPKIPTQLYEDDDLIMRRKGHLTLISRTE